MQIHVIRTLDDNYSYLVEYNGGEVLAVDPSDSKPVQRLLERHRLQLRHILITHSHFDHTAGVPELRRRSGCTVYGPDFTALAADQPITAGPLRATALPTPGHTAAAVCWLVSGPGGPDALFAGDTLFVSGCGRIIGTDAETMYGSLRRLAALGDETLVYAGHEYTEENCRFAVSLAPHYPPFQERLEEVRELLGMGRPTVPSTLAAERVANPFLMADSPVIREALKMPDKPAWQVFAELRRRKDRFA